MVVALLFVLGPASAHAGPAEAVADRLRAPGVRLLVLRAAGDEHRWRDLPRPEGLVHEVLDPRAAEAVGLAPGQAAAWTWQGRRVVDRGGPEDVLAAIGRHLGPKPRVWIDTRDPTLRHEVRRALRRDGRWAVTHRHQDIVALRSVTTDRGPCADLTPPPLSLLRIDGGEASWLVPARACRAVTARRDRAPALVEALLAGWRTPPALEARAPAGEASGPPGPRRFDRHVRQEIARSRRALATLNEQNSDPRLIDAVRPWIGVRYQRDGTTSNGVDDIQLIRNLYADAYGVELSPYPLDWLQAYEKVPVDESNPDATVRAGDLLFKVTLSYRPREVLLYLGGGKVVTAKEVRGVVVTKTPRNLSVKYYLVARRPRLAPAGGRP